MLVLFATSLSAQNTFQDNYQRQLQQDQQQRQNFENLQQRQYREQQYGRQPC